MSEFPKIGEPVAGDETVFELVLSDYFKPISTKDFGLDREGISPRDYYVTSGDAIQKTKYLERLLWKLSGDLRRECIEVIASERSISMQAAYQHYLKTKEPAGLRAYEFEIWKLAGKARKLRNALIQARGEHCFLETDWEGSKLLCIAKNPRGWPSRAT
ncbi:hypothetical protein [Rhodopirellula halodulae]|uniref:hypothetical protein n=1 Tax=Rhodopirellula halodulae TaxID=2894198 RepID=UPI001E393BBB|nr:hypothetical protein [Rhodopirellula sp. JC737]MCC9655282.1 hypothetical protein [Rhodopirellula sp. JC737]